MSAPSLFDGLDQERFNDLALRFMTAMQAVIQFGRGDQDYDRFYAAAVTKAVVCVVAAIITDHSDRIEDGVDGGADEALVAEISVLLRSTVADFRMLQA